MKKLMIVLTMALSLNTVNANAYGYADVYCKANFGGTVIVAKGSCPMGYTFIGTK